MELKITYTGKRPIPIFRGLAFLKKNSKKIHRKFTNKTCAHATKKGIYHAKIRKEQENRKRIPVLRGLHTTNRSVDKSRNLE